MRVEVQWELVRAAGPLTPPFTPLDGRVIISQGNLPFRVVERLAEARDDLILDTRIGSELAEGLRLKAEVSPPTGQRAEPGAQAGTRGWRP